MPQSVTPHLQIEGEEWEDTCMELGFEFVDTEEMGRNQFGGGYTHAKPEFPYLVIQARRARVRSIWQDTDVIYWVRTNGCCKGQRSARS